MNSSKTKVDATDFKAECNLETLIYINCEERIIFGHMNGQQAQAGQRTDADGRDGFQSGRLPRNVHNLPREKNRGKSPVVNVCPSIVLPCNNQTWRNQERKTRQPKST
jgi:hypothetical protein